jgi:hypothetical protein
MKKIIEIIAIRIGINQNGDSFTIFDIVANGYSSKFVLTLFDTTRSAKKNHL